eukprot:SAG31_NODE_8434_length_1452_cov_8.988395_1_plen_229_part_00
MRELNPRPRARAKGVALGAHAQCYVQLGDAIEVPDDPALRATAGQGGEWDMQNYDASLGPYRCDDDYRLSARADWENQRYGPIATTRGPFGTGSIPEIENEYDVENTVGAWYKLPPGRSLVRAPIGYCHCGTLFTWWLTGWQESDGPMLTDADRSYAEPARADMPPPLGEPPKRGAVCFQGCCDFCNTPKEVMGLQCGGFELWQLPPAWICGGGGAKGYCLDDDAHRR